MKNHRTRELPPHLYKYVSVEGKRRKYVEDCVVHGNVYLSSPAGFNDPFDCRANLTFNGDEEELAITLKEVDGTMSMAAARHEARAYITSGALKDPATVAAVRASMQSLINTWGVYCLAESPAELLMWAHYAQSHSGLCLVFDSSFSPFCDAIDVRYSASYPTLPFSLKDNEAVALSLLFTKAVAWAYEREWRLFEYAAGPLPYSPGALKQIVVGCRASDATKALAAEWAKKVGATFAVARVNPRSFGIEIDATAF